MALNLLTDKMSEQIEYIVMRRQQNWDYIKRAHQGKVHWLNVMKLSKASIVANFPPEKLQKRIRRWFLLGLSLGRLLELGEGAPLVRALSQLVEEYEHFIGAKKDLLPAPRAFGEATAAQLGAGEGGAPGQGHGTQLLLAPFLFLGAAQASASSAAAIAASASAHAPASTLGAGGTGLGGDGSGHFALKPSLHKNSRGQVVYAYLQTAGAASGMVCESHMDYCELVQSLCDVLSLVYSKFLDASCAPPAVHLAVLRVDRKLKALVMAKLVADLAQDVATPLLKSELQGLLNHLFVDNNASHTGAARRFIQLDGLTAEGTEFDSDEDTGTK